MSIFSYFNQKIKKKMGDVELEEELSNYFEASTKYRSSARRAGVILILDASQDLFEAIRFLVEKCEFEMRVIHVETSSLAETVVRDYGAGKIKAILAHADFIDNEFIEWVKDSNSEIPVFVTSCPEDQEKSIPDNFPVLVKGRARVVDYVEAIGFPDSYKEHIEDLPSHLSMV